ncbi:hypothetical protein SYJ56_18785 [Algoriphagus sp. D3-2-R+10]|uniref:hypothetical protein n=1 Tax=Algoriphagus aurantiacus TaxID=3103948 RepID=UPI002B366C94|nr:hypothetical protein [Algoriphagus sp. D3-2-R+10]MEB2777368.1 hypothetical protein [Algoriphagus sp. D3-2-R+10]
MQWKNVSLPFLILILFGACKSMKPSADDKLVYASLKEINFPFKKVKSADGAHFITEFLDEKQLETLASWKGSKPPIKSLLQSECLGCPDPVSKLSPMYRFKKGKFIHYGFKNSLGVQNWVFRKNGAFIRQFYMYQGDNPNQIIAAMSNKNLEEYSVIEGIYPIEVTKKEVYQEVVEYNNSQALENWYSSPFPTKLAILQPFQTSKVEVQYKFNSGLYSHQETDLTGKFKIINFVEPVFIANAVSQNQHPSYISSTDGYYANATFYLITLDEDAALSIEVNSKIKAQQFKFSVFENNAYRSLEEYRTLPAELLESYQGNLKKGGYLIRIIHEGPEYREEPLFKIKIKKVIQ